MCDVLESFEGWLVMCRVSGCGCMPVNVWPSGADWITLSLANCSCDGATMLRPGGAPRLRARPGVLAEKWLPSLSLSGPSPLADCCCNLASMICRWWSLTVMLRCTLAFITGSCVMKPGDKHASPTSWISSLPSRAVSGRAVAGETMFEFLERSNFLGLCRVVGRSGDPGSFLTTILGPPPFRDLRTLDSVN